VFTATAISRIDNLEFLSDTVPKTKSYRQYREEKEREAEAKTANANGDPNGTNGESSRSIQTMMQNGTNGVNGTGPEHGNGARPASSHSRTHSHPDPIRDLDTDMTG
jgi:hypothetical protein